MLNLRKFKKLTKNITKGEMLGVIFTFILLVGVYMLFKNIDENAVNSIIQRAGFWAPMVFVLITLVTLVFAPIGGTPILYAGFYAFGINVVILSTLASYIAFIINFLIAKTLGRPFIAKMLGADKIEKIDNFVTNHGLWTLFLLRIFQGGIHDFVSYAFGLTSMKLIPYFIVSIIATIPGTAIWYYLTSYIKSPEVFLLVSWGLVIFFSAVFIGWGIVKKRMFNQEIIP